MKKLFSLLTCIFLMTNVPFLSAQDESVMRIENFELKMAMRTIQQMIQQFSLEENESPTKESLLNKQDYKVFRKHVRTLFSDHKRRDTTLISWKDRSNIEKEGVPNDCIVNMIKKCVRYSHLLSDKH